MVRVKIKLLVGLNGSVMKIKSHMDAFVYLSSLRVEVLEIVTGVENSKGGWFWDNTTPNWQTKSKLDRLYTKYLKDAARFGLYIVTRYSSCPNPEHPEYPTTNLYGLDIYYNDGYNDGDYIWDGDQLYQGERYCICPCSLENKPTKHWVIDDVLYKKGSDVELCKALKDILSYVYESINYAGDNQPRSAIREYLLLTVLKINDQLLFEPMDVYIEKFLSSHSKS